MSKYIPAILRILLGSVFVFSAITKLFPIEIFELNFVYSGFISWALAPWFARILISIELMLGISLILNVKPRAFTIPASLILLVFFTFYLSYSLAVDGNEGNCGCFGTLLPMTPIESIIKNFVMIGLLIFVYKKHEIRQIPKFLKWTPLFSFVVSFVILLIVLPVTFNAEAPQQEVLNKKANFLNYSDFNGAKNTDLKKGKHIVTFFSIGCDHCKEVAMKIGIINKKYGLPPVHYFLWGRKENLDEFFNDTKTRFPYKILDNKEFFSICGQAVPHVLVLDNGIIKAEWYYKDFSPEALKQIFF